MSYSKKPRTINPDEVDPSVYYYDEVYDEMKDEEQSKTTEQKISGRELDRKSKYIEGLKETAEQRKTDKEIRKFKKYTRDREEVTEDVSSENVYITSAYRKKLNEIEKLESEKRHQIEAEKYNSMNFAKRDSSRVDVTKNKKEENTSVQDRSNVPSSSKIHDKAQAGYKDHRHIVEKEDSSVDPNPTRLQLRSLEDRRVYLRKVLAKRTVGKVHDEAVQRYIERKARSQN